MPRNEIQRFSVIKELVNIKELKESVAHVWPVTKVNYPKWSCIKAMDECKGKCR